MASTESASVDTFDIASALSCGGFCLLMLFRHVGVTQIELLFEFHRISTCLYVSSCLVSLLSLSPFYLFLFFTSQKHRYLLMNVCLTYTHKLHYGCRAATEQRKITQQQQRFHSSVYITLIITLRFSQPTCNSLAWALKSH